ncbi:hypothetical protein Pelo_1725 [Pelomyxa schiedti]|nr:hypothetical protein Pelo_1725 [Pelomyxa schiedti]
MLQPGLVVTKTIVVSRTTGQLFDNSMPPQLLRLLVLPAEYNDIISKVNHIVHECHPKSTGAKYGTLVGTLVAAPVAAVVGIATLGMGIPFSAGILLAGGALGGGTGASVGHVSYGSTLSNLNSFIDGLNASWHARNCHVQLAHLEPDLYKLVFEYQE